MAKSRHFRLKSTFSSALILCNAVCSMTPGLSWSRDGKTTYGDLTQSTERMSPGSSSRLQPPAKRKHALLESWEEESRKKGSSVLSDIGKFLASENQDQLAPSTPLQNLQGPVQKTAQRDSRGTHDSYDPKRAQEPHAQTEREMVAEMKGALSNWDKRQRDFIEELRRSPPDCLAHVLEPSNQEAGKNPQGPSKRIQDKGKFSNLVAKENQAESERVDALNAATIENWNQVERYLNKFDALLEFHLDKLLPSLPAGDQIFMLKMNDIPVSQLLARAIPKAVGLRREVRNTLISERDSRQYFGSPSIPEVQKYLAEEFVEYSRILLSILAQASRNYRWDLSDISSLVPKTWFASIHSDEKSIISHRITALQKLHLGDIEAAKKHFEEATKIQAAMNEVHRSLHAMGLRTWSLGEDSKYVKLRDELNRLQENLSLPPIEDIETQLGKLTTKRIYLEETWKLKVAHDALIDPEDFVEQSTKELLDWETSKHRMYNSKETLELHIKKEMDWQADASEELLDGVFESFGAELKARAAFLGGHPFQSHWYLTQAYKQQKKVEYYTQVWIDRKALHLDWAGVPDYVKLKEIEKELKSMGAKRSSDQKLTG